MEVRKVLEMLEAQKIGVDDAVRLLEALGKAKPEKGPEPRLQEADPSSRFREVVRIPGIESRDIVLEEGQLLRVSGVLSGDVTVPAGARVEVSGMMRGTIHLEGGEAKVSGLVIGGVKKGERGGETLCTGLVTAGLGESLLRWVDQARGFGRGRRERAHGVRREGQRLVVIERAEEDVTVAEGESLEVVGKLEGRVTLEPGSSAEIAGSLIGDVTGEATRLQVAGKIRGCVDLTRSTLAVEGKIDGPVGLRECTAQVSGKLAGDAVLVSAGTLRLQGTVREDITVEDGGLLLIDGGTVSGDVRLRGGHVENRDGRIRGDVIDLPSEPAGETAQTEGGGEGGEG